MITVPAQAMEDLLARKSELASRSCAEPGFEARLRELQSWQAARLARTYADLNRDPRYAPALKFFLSDLYGPRDFADRDRDLLRAWRYLKHSLPATALQALGNAIELEVLTAELDHATIKALAPGALSEPQYIAAYRAVGRREERQRQIDLVIGAGEVLERTVRHAWLGAVLKAAHRPAHAAGFGVLQDFVERGYDAFRKMGDASRLLNAIRERECALMEALFSGSDRPFAVLDTLGKTTNE